MRVEKDEFSGLPVAEDAYPPLRAFREAGAKSFHNFSVEQVREMYIESCESAPLHEKNEPAQADYLLEDFHVRLYEPRRASDQEQPTPAVLFLHGGGWVMGDLRTHHFAARRIAARTGFPVLAVDYRLAPEHPYPAAIDDTRAALRWLLDAENPHGVQVSSISVIGDSAGGQLAAVLVNETAGSETVLDSQVLLYPVTDLRDENIATSESYQRITEGFPLVADTMVWFADNYVERGDIRRNPDLSPQCADLPKNLPATYIVTVDNDPLAAEGRRYAEKIQATGAEIVYDHLVGYAHGVFTSAGRIPTGEQYLNKAADFISAHTHVVSTMK